MEVSIDIKKKKKKIALIFLVFTMIIYGFGFKAVHMIVGNGAFILMNVFPAAAGLLFGMTGGFMCGLITIFFVVFLGSSVYLDLKAFLPTITVSGIVMLIIGSGVGRLRDLSLAVKRELNKRREVEKALKKSKDELEIRIKERTRELEQTTIELKKEITENKQARKAQEELQAQLTQTRKMESVGRLAGGIAHDFNNMLGVILGHAEMILEKLDPVLPIYADLEEIRKAALNSAGLTRQLLAFARKQTVAPKLINMNRTLKGMLRMLQRLMGEDVDLVWLPGRSPGPVYIDPSQIDQMLVNLCVNARDAIVNTGRITIETGTAVFDEDYCSEHAGFVPGEFVFFSVSDDGCGMDEETLAQVFEPFFTTKERGKGTGLGLATVYGIAKQNNGHVNVCSEPGQGATFKIYLPRHIGNPGRIEAEKPGKSGLRGQETILLVEDEPAILTMTTRMLERQGYTVVAAGTPGEAIRLAEEYTGKIHLLMTDVVMPEMNGRDLSKILLSSFPDLKCLFMSGYTANVIAHHGVLDKGIYFISKPFTIKDLSVKVREVMEKK